MIGIPFLGLAAGNSKLPSVTPRQLPFQNLNPSRGISLTRHRAFWGGQYPIRWRYVKRLFLLCYEASKIACLPRLVKF